MDVIDGVTLQFMANMNHYHKYLEKNKATKTAFRDLSFYHDRFLELTRLLCQSRLPHAETNSQPRANENTPPDNQTTVHPENQPETQPPDKKLLAVGTIYTVNEESRATSDQDRATSDQDLAQDLATSNQDRAQDGQDIHQDVQEAFNRYVETCVTYFQFIDRSNELQKEYDGMQTTPDNENAKAENEAFNVEQYQMNELLNQDHEKKKKCTLDLFVNKHKNANPKKMPSIKRVGVE